MYEINFLEVKIRDILIPKNGNGKLSMEYCQKHKGEYPIYSSNNTDIFGFCDTYDYDGNYLTWSLVGCAGYITELNGKFSITNNRGIIIIKEEYEKQLNIKYLKYILEPIFRRNIKGRLGVGGKNEYTQLNRKMINEIEEKIQIPIREDGTFDIEKQEEIADKIEKINKKKKELEIKKMAITNMSIDYSSSLKMKEIRIRDILIPKNGNGKLSMEYCQKHKGEYPIYSSNNTDIFGFCDTYDYDGNYLTWSLVGCAGYITELNGKFSITNNRGIIIIKEEYEKQLNIKYLKYILEPIFRRNIKGRLGVGGKNEYTQLNRKMINEIEEKIQIPIRKDGTFDIEKQEEIADKIQRVSEIKKKIIENIDGLINLNIKLI